MCCYVHGASLPRAPAAPTAPLLIWHLLQVMVEVHLMAGGHCQVSTKGKTTLENTGEEETAHKTP